MKNIFLKSVVVLITLMAMLTSTAYADRERHDKKQKHSRSYQKHSLPHFKMDRRYSHNHSYPRKGHIINTWPRKRAPIHYRNKNYFYFGGVWHLSSGSNLVVVRPPLGVIVPVLPPYYTTVWFHNTPYYYANDQYYVWRPDRNGYQVTAPPTTEDQAEPAYLADEIFIYPKQGQNEEQQASDRYSCHRWGVEQTSYDPTQPPDNLSRETLSQQRENYNRAMKTCLEGKQYSVR